MLFSFCHVTLSSSIAVMPLGTAGIWKVNCNNYSLGQKHTLCSIPPSTYCAASVQPDLLEDSTQSCCLTVDSWPLSTRGLQAAWQTQSIHSSALLHDNRIPPLSSQTSISSSPVSSASDHLPIPMGKLKHSADEPPTSSPFPHLCIYWHLMLMDATVFFAFVDELSSLHLWPPLPQAKKFHPSPLIPSKSSLFLLR